LTAQLSGRTVVGMLTFTLLARPVGSTTPQWQTLGIYTEDPANPGAPPPVAIEQASACRQYMNFEPLLISSDGTDITPPAP
jgi:hypothetical protein